MPKQRHGPYPVAITERIAGIPDKCFASPFRIGNGTSPSVYPSNLNSREVGFCNITRFITSAKATSGTLHLSDGQRSISILRRPFSIVDHNHVNGPLGRFQFQAQLFLQGSED
jgi:hypothetical protein